MAIIASQNPFECTPATPARFIGEFASLSALQTAHPTAPGGSYAVVNAEGADLIYYYSLTDEDWFTQEGGPGSTPTLPQVLAQGDRTIRNSDGDGETILELNDRGKLIYNPDGDFLYIPAELYPVGTVIKIHNTFDGIDVFCVPDEELNPSIQINGVNVDEFSGITLNSGTAVFKKINGDPFSESWILTYEVLEFSKSALSLGAVDNTSDEDKPVSTAQAAAISAAQTNAQTYAKNYTDALRIKQPARFAVGTNVASLSGPITIQANLVTTDTILLLAQTDQKENGLWVVNGSGAWTRPEDFKTGSEAKYCLFTVLSDGKRYGTGNIGVVGTANIVLQEVTGTSASTTSWMSQSTPRTLDNTTALQKIFNVGTSGNGSLPVVAGKRYKCTGWVVLSALTTSSKTLSFGILGTATASYVSGTVSGNANTGVGTAQIVNISSFSATQVTSGSTATASRMRFEIEFICSGSGSIIPSILTSVSTTGMQVDSAFFDLIEIGESSANASSNAV
jgi:hypothetical protein